MSQDLTNKISPEIINSLILTGDMSKLTAGQQTQYYNAVCESVGINPLTQPFAIITLQGKKILYATKGCTQQLSDTRKISTEIKERKTIDSVYQASCRATGPDGRFTDDDGIVSIAGLKGIELANAMMKAVTKAKRRAVLAYCGLGMPDETEIEDIPQSTSNIDSNKSRLENIIDAQHEVKEDDQKVENKPEILKEGKKTNSKNDKESDQGHKNIQVSNEKTDPLPNGHKIIVGLVEEIPKVATVEKDGKPAVKHSFRIGDLRYGTFDIDMAKKIMECIDKRIMVKFEFTERKSGDKIFNDIEKFSQAVAEKDVPI